MNKKLYVLNVGISEICVVAGYKDEILYIQKMAVINSRRPDDLKKLRREMAVYKKRGFLVTVSEPIPRLAGGFHTSNLAGKDSSDKPRLVAAITAYQQLINRNALRFMKSARKVSIPDSVYEKEVSDNGAISYRIDWDSISEEALALLVTVYNAVYHSSTEATYLSAVFNTINQRKRSTRFSLGGKL